MVAAVRSPLHPFMLVGGFLSPTDWRTTTKLISTPPPMIIVPTLYISLSSLVYKRLIKSMFVLFGDTFIRPLEIMASPLP